MWTSSHLEGAGQATNGSTSSNVASAKREIAFRAMLEVRLKLPSARAELAGTDGGWQERSPGRDLPAEPGLSCLRKSIQTPEGKARPYSAKRTI